MANKFSFVTLWDGDKVTDHITISREKGDAMLRVLHGIDEPANEKQSEFLLRVKSIYPGLRTDAPEPSEAQSAYWQGLDEKAAHTKAVEAGEHLTHTGIEQGVSQQIPSGDR